MNVRKKYPVKEATDAQLKAQEKGVFELEKKEANANRAKALKKRQQELSKEGSSNWREELLNEVEVSKLDDKRSKAAREAMLQALEQQAVKKKKQLAKEANDPAREHLIQRKQLMLERQKRQAEKNKAFADRAKKAGYKNPQDYANVVARYGSEDNMKKGKGLGT